MGLRQKGKIRHACADSTHTRVTLFTCLVHLVLASRAPNHGGKWEGSKSASRHQKPCAWSEIVVERLHAVSQTFPLSIWQRHLNGQRVAKHGKHRTEQSETATTDKYSNVTTLGSQLLWGFHVADHRPHT